MGCSGDCYVRKRTVEELTAYGTIGSLGVALSLLESVLGILLTVVGLLLSTLACLLGANSSIYSLLALLEGSELGFLVLLFGLEGGVRWVGLLTALVGLEFSLDGIDLMLVLFAQLLPALVLRVEFAYNLLGILVGRLCLCNSLLGIFLSLLGSLLSLEAF